VRLNAVYYLINCGNDLVFLTCRFCFLLKSGNGLRITEACFLPFPLFFYFQNKKREEQRHGETFYPLQRRWTANRNGKGKISKSDGKMGA
jgi:hypothetical protein